MVTIYHNPRCSKSRACLQLLQQSGVAVEVVNYLQHPLSLELLRRFAAQLGLKAMVRNNEEIFKKLKLTEVDDETILKAVLNHPQLLQRPIVVVKGHILIARPPEKALELIND